MIQKKKLKNKKNVSWMNVNMYISQLNSEEKQNRSFCLFFNFLNTFISPRLPTTSFGKGHTVYVN